MVKKIILILKIIWRLPDLFEEVRSSSESLKVCAEWMGRFDPVFQKTMETQQLLKERMSQEDINSQLRELRLRQAEFTSYTPVTRADIKYRNDSMVKLEAEITRLVSLKESIS
jgi:hypothetical protein